MKDVFELLKESKTIAVVGISDKPGRDSGRIAVFLKDKGYNVYGVHPVLTEVNGIPVYKKITDIPVDIDIVDVFLNSNLVPDIVTDVLEKKPKAVWLQLGVNNDEAVKTITENGIDVIQNLCIAIEHRHFFN